MDERVFGPPPNTGDKKTERPTRSSLRRLLLNGRRRKTRTTRP